MLQSKSGQKMRFSHAVILASLAALVPAGPAAAQGYFGQDVLVNPYAGGQRLLQPGERASDRGPIQLHMPTRKTAVRTAKAPAPQRSARLTPPPSKPVQSKPIPPKPAPAPVAPVPAAPQGLGINPFAFNSVPPNPLTPNPQAPNPVAPKPAAPQPAPKPAPAPPKLARAEPPPRSVTTPPAAAIPGLTRRSSILFAADATDPAQSALGAIKFLAGDLNTAMTGPSSRIELKAYGGARGDKSSDAHRLALKRALAIRQILIDDGVATDRIDVQAVGGADDDGPTDRVDVYIKA